MQGSLFCPLLLSQQMTKKLEEVGSVGFIQTAKSLQGETPRELSLVNLLISWLNEEGGDIK